MYIPNIVEKENGIERTYDIASYMLKHRNVYLNGEVNEQTAFSVILQMQFLAAEDPTKDINFYINSPGGHVDQGLAIYDTMHSLKCDVNTIGYGLCASMGAFLLTCGTVGKRFALPNLNLMYHQPLTGGIRGQETDVSIAAEHLKDTRYKLELYISKKSKINYEKVHSLCERDNYMKLELAIEYGFIDNIIK